MSNITPLQEISSPLIKDTKGLTINDNKGIVIFLVDDNALYLKSLEIQFSEERDLLVKTFLTGEACLESISLKPDIVVLDYFLDTANNKAMNGLETLVQIKKASPGTQVIIFSAHERTETAVNCIKNGAFDYIVKDEKTFFKLKKSIKKILEIHSKEKELIVWDW